MEIKTCRIETDEGNAEAVVAAIPALCRLKNTLMETAAVVREWDPAAVGDDQYVPVADVLDAIRESLTPGETAVLATVLLSTLGMCNVQGREDAECEPSKDTTFFPTMCTAG